MSHAVFRTVGMALFFTVPVLPLFAECPIAAGSTLVVRAPIGNLNVDTTGSGVVRTTVDGQGITLQETCGADRVEVTAEAPARLRGLIEWQIVVPRSVHLDLVTLGGSITMGDSDGNVTVRTTGGSVIVGNVKGRAVIVTQGGSIKAGNVGENAEFRSSGVGNVEVGDIAGNAELHTAGGPITAGAIDGRVNVSTAGGTISIRRARGEVIAVSEAGDIRIGDAGGINAKTADGHITSQRVRGSFQGHTETGNIRLESVTAWVEASTGFGDIFVRMAPDILTGDLHVNLETGVGNVTLFMPQMLRATVQAVIDRPAIEGQRIFSDFPMNAMVPASPSVSTNRFLSPVESQSILNGGGNIIKLHTSLGKIEIRKN